MDLSTKEVNEIIDKVCDFLDKQVLRSDIIFAKSLINDLQKIKEKYPSGSSKSLVTVTTLPWERVENKDLITKASDINMFKK